MIIEATRNQNWLARLDETPDGIAVTIIKRSAKLCGGEVQSVVSRDTLECPFHVACDRILDLLNQLPGRLPQ